MVRFYRSIWIHQPAMYDIDGIMYCNTGDWVENCSVLVEHRDGRLELLYWRDVLAKEQGFRGDAERQRSAMRRDAEHESFDGEYELVGEGC